MFSFSKYVGFIGRRWVEIAVGRQIKQLVAKFHLDSNSQAIILKCVSSI